ncbi:hypothetical protein B0A55_04702 [Friedmanniomyces simplex]|uniref:Uncharacterized protein n=1 Tax=Friedmanniomyces simplex TaxID=329884 RepID=A0A4U0XD25_9PEZI|nr:hypothetical protein B0A55_04702 [Friedmanniomyces simplex]
MSTSQDQPSPAESWQTDTEASNDDMEFELADSDVSGVSEDMEDEAAETTLYYDAEEGVLRDEDGDTVTFEVGDESLDDASEDLESQAQAEEETEVEEEAEGTQTPQPAAATTASSSDAQQAQRATQTILQLLSQAGIRGVFQPTGGVTTRSQARRANAQHVELAEDDDEDGHAPDDDDDEMNDAYLGYGGRRRPPRRPVVGDRYPKIPSEEGRRLMDSGTFGTNDRCDHTACGHPISPPTLRKRRKLAHRMLDRELGLSGYGSHGSRVLGCLASQDLIPRSKADLIVNLNARCYSGQFSDDGSFFFACGQDFKVRMYDTSNPYDWKYYKTVHYYGGQWTITDASLSPDNKFLAYSSIRSQICLANTEQGDDSEPHLLDFSNTGSGGHGGAGGGGWGRSRGHFGIWSLRFSGDGREIVAGTSDQSVYVYDLEARRSILRIPAHQDDVNAVCFGDKMSPHILYSGSDDTTVKVWDRRSLASMRPAGMFLGHTEGVTYIDSKGDGRYVISNGKDQTCKLWDLRRMVGTEEGEGINPQDFTTNFDYRFAPYDTASHRPHPHDCSLVTFRGHRVLKTLIRCHFSPPTSTDQRYIYSGSHDGKIYVWNLDGTLAGEPINVLAATKNSRPMSDERYVDQYDYYGRGGEWKTIVRDCSWHPTAPVIAATSWNGWDHGLGTCTVHSWNDGVDGDEVGGDEDGFAGASAETMGKGGSLGSTAMGARVTAQLRHDERFYGDTAREQGTTRRTRLRDRMGLGESDGSGEESGQGQGNVHGYAGGGPFGTFPIGGALG